MNLKKNLGRIATAFVATAMLASLTAVPASAADAEQGQVNTALNELKINKVLTLPTEVATPKQFFDFQVQPATVEGTQTVTLGEATFPLYTGVGTIETNGVTFDPAEDANHRVEGDTNDTVTYEVVFDLTQATGFEAAGVYKYTIDEVTTGLSDDYLVKTNGLDLYLMVERVNGANTAVSDADTYMITGAYIYPKGDTMADTETKTADYNNWYKLDDSGKKVGDLNFTKFVKGAMANKSDTFTFTVTGEGIEAGVEYTIVRDNQETTLVASEDAKLEFAGVENGTDITIKGLDAGSYIVEETNMGVGYDVSYKIGEEAEVTDDASAELTVVAKNTAEVEFTNTRDSVSPTGIVMDVAPYALLVVVAAAGCFVFLRKRRED